MNAAADIDMPPRARAAPRWTIALIAVGAVLLLGLFARIMTFPLSHDEEIHVAASRLVFQAPLYQSLGYNHLPGLPLLLGGIYALTGTTHLLLTGRILIFLAWLLAGLALVLIARRSGAGRPMAILACLLFAGTGLAEGGMLVTNNFLPIPFALLALHAFLSGLEEGRPRPLLLFAAGLCIAFAVSLKISYVFLIPPFALAALFAPVAGSFGARLRLVLLPIVAGGLVGLIPAAIVILRDPGDVVAHVFRYFIGPHRAYWQASTEPKAMSIAAKVLIAEQSWLSGTALLAALLAASLWVVARARGGASWRAEWPLLLTLALVASAALLAFVPTPAFPQYYEPPAPFVVVLMILAFARLDAKARAEALPFLGIAGAIALAILALRLGDLPTLARPGRWTGVALHQEGMRLRQAIERSGVAPIAASLSPILPLEGQVSVYPEFAAGPFVYRVAEFIPSRDRRWYTTTSAADLPRFLAAHRPGAIIVGRERTLDGPFEAFAQAHGYRLVDIGGDRSRVYIAPARTVLADEPPL
jgi:hypothetical protein